MTFSRQSTSGWSIVVASIMLLVPWLLLLLPCKFIVAFSLDTVRHPKARIPKISPPSFMLSRHHHYPPPPPSFRDTHLELSSEVDFEYIPPNPSNLFTTSDSPSSGTTSLSPRLSSVYPPGTPAGLRGEAVRSALLSKRCIAWDLSPSHDEQQSSSSTTSSLSCGWIRVKGKGTIDFLQNKFTQSLDPSTSSSSSFSYTKACLLTPKGRVVDQISIALVQPNEAFLMTSPGHAGSSLFQRLDPLIFPMDQVTLMDESSSSQSSTTKIFSIASTHIQHVQNAIVTYVTPVLNQHNYQLLEVSSSSSSSSSSSLVSSLQTPSSDANFVQYTLKYMTTKDNNNNNNDNNNEDNNNNNNNNNNDDDEDDDRITMTILPQIHLSPSACQGYTIVLSGSDDKKHAAAIKERIWEALVGDENSNGPVEIGMLEYETLRIETGWPAYGKEVTAGLPQHQKKKKKNNKSPQKTTTTTTNDDESLHEMSPTTAASASSSSNSSSSKRRMTPANPLELHWDRDFVNTEKGCYLGQEGVASILKNPKGPPRTLYSVIFEDEGNIYDHESEGDNSDVENLTTTPVPGNELFVLGSNEQIAVGTLTSVADAGGTGEPCTVALALVKRPASILTQMKRMDLEVGYTNPLLEDDTPPPPRMMNTIESDGGGGIHEDNRNAVASESSGIIQPPPLDPLEGLEVIVGGTFTIGKLQAVPSRRYIRGENMFEVAVANNGIGNNNDEAGMDGSVMGVRFTDVLQVERTIPSRDEDVIANKDVAAVAATTASATPSTDNYVPPVGYDIDHQEEEEEEDDVELALEEVAKAQAEAEAAAAEAQRKADKMEMLKKRAEEAMARRQKAKEDAMNTNKETENVEKSSFTGNDNNNNNNKEEKEEEEDAVAAEAKRKAEKMEMLRKRAEEAMARRTQKKNEGS